MNICLIKNSKKISFFSFKFLGLLALLSLCFTGCLQNKSSIKSEPVSAQNNTTILATFYPLYIMLQNITQDIPDVKLELLAPANTGCLHDYQLTTKDMKKIEQCSILVCNGNGMEDFIEKAVAIKKQNTIISSEGYPLVDNNPHIWVSPMGAIYQVNKITEKLCTLDQKNKDSYIKNSNDYILKLNTLANKMQLELKPLAGTSIITFHEAFPYFASEFNLKIEETIERDAGTEPNPKELSALIKKINNFSNLNKKVFLFAEPGFSSSAAQIIAKETLKTVYQLDPCVTGELTKDAYLNAQEKNLNVLKGLYTSENNEL